MASAPRTKEEQKFQHCNYGYDTSKYKSFDDCMKNYYKFNKSDLPDTLNVTSTPVLCNDGTTLMQLSSPTGRYSDACMNNGGRAEKQPVVNAPVKTQSTSSKIKKITGAYNQNLIIAVVLIAGYFAYKKFKK